MPRNLSREWLYRLLEGDIPSAQELKQLLHECEVEDQWIEYKSGLELKKADPAPAATVRQYVSGFANAEGGTLVVGYNQETKKIDGAEAKGGGPLKEWAGNAVSGLISLPQPRFVVVPVDGVEVLLLAVSRSAALIPCIERSEAVYWLRIGHETKQVPTFLVSDLMLGRRAHAALRVRVSQAGFVSSNPSSGYPDLPLRELGLRLRIENTTIAHAEDVRAGLIGWTLGQPPLPNAALRQACEIVEPEALDWLSPRVHPWTLQHVRARRFLAAGSREGPPWDLGPFEESPEEWLRPWAVPIFMRQLADQLQVAEVHRKQLRGLVRMSAAVYVLAKGDEPSWHQLIFEYDDRVTGLGADLGKRFQVSRVQTRPAVSFEFLP